ncbi:pyridoxal phosphate-dependent decarboxylase family protein [Streptomyces sp. NPDC050743]|uniref:pyridoxal phosphate-dependent decarboxylase family protein n=1 Tax=Streptomyces sp. NPDC050743 TaxID=3365634 RepID=UPI0037914DCC
MGGTLPGALAADWLVSAWDQNAGQRLRTPAVAALEEAAGAWLPDLRGLPDTASVGFVTGATMANFTGLAAVRQAVLAGTGWDVSTAGLAGAPPVHVLVGAERHDTIDLALRYLGLGQPRAVPAHAQGRIRTDALADAIALSHARGAWVHVDGAFGLWAAACPDLRHLVARVEAADSWATDAHKTLNVPYDCGVAIVAHPEPLSSTMGIRASYLMSDAAGPADPQAKVPALSRRARGVPVWAALRSLGREGVADLVARLAHGAWSIAEQIAAIDNAQVLNDVVYTHVSVAFGDDERPREVTARLLADGTAWMSGSRRKGRDVLRVSVSNWTTDQEDGRRSVEALRHAWSER